MSHVVLQGIYLEKWRLPWNSYREQNLTLCHLRRDYYKMDTTLGVISLVDINVAQHKNMHQPLQW